MRYFSGLLAIVFLFSYHLIPVENVFCEEIDVKKAIAIIKKNENSIHSLSWESEVKITEAGTSNTTVTGRARLAFDTKNRFRLEKSETRTWVGGLAPLNTRKLIATFDGHVLRSEEKSGPGKNLPDKKVIGEGKISKIPDNFYETINWQGLPEGIGYFFPFVGCWDEVDKLPNIFLPKLSDTIQILISNKKEVKITENEEGIWSIVYPIKYIEEAKIQLYNRVDYDPAKGLSGAILSVQCGDYAKISDTTLEPTITFSLVKVGDFFVPELVKIHYGYNDKGIVNSFQYIMYKDIEINKSLADSDFQINWEKGTNVYDLVAEKFYVVTGDPVDEAEAVTAFKNIYGLNRHSVFDDNSRVVVFRTILVLLGLLLITYGLYLRFKKEK